MFQVALLVAIDSFLSDYLTVQVFLDEFYLQWILRNTFQAALLVASDSLLADDLSCFTYHGSFGTRSRIIPCLQIAVCNLAVFKIMFQESV